MKNKDWEYVDGMMPLLDSLDFFCKKLVYITQASYTKVHASHGRGAHHIRNKQVLDKTKPKLKLFPNQG